MGSPFENNTPTNLGPAMGAIAVTPSDTVDLSTFIRAVTLNAGGTLSYKDWRGITMTTNALPAGTYSLFASRIMSTGTTATGITGWI